MIIIVIKKKKKVNKWENKKSEFSNRISQIKKIYTLFYFGMVGYVVPGLE